VYGPLSINYSNSVHLLPQIIPGSVYKNTLTCDGLLNYLSMNRGFSRMFSAQEQKHLTTTLSNLIRCWSNHPTFCYKWPTFSYTSLDAGQIRRVREGRFGQNFIERDEKLPVKSYVKKNIY
jgi:hypothetical protein